MSKIKDKLGEVKVHNAHNFAGHGNVYIAYSPNEYGRIMRPARWQVVRPGFKTDPDGHWMNYGHKTFLLVNAGETHKEKKEIALEEAKAWASERYGITEWAKTPFGDWMDADFVKARLKELLED